MANLNFKRIVADGPENAVVELIGNLDTSAATFAVAPAIDISADFVNNLQNATFVGIRLSQVQYSISDGLAVQLYWDATADRLMVGLAGRGKLCFEKANGLQPVRGDAGYTGDVDLIVSNIVVAAGTPIQTYTLLLYFVKLYTVP